MFNAYNDAGCKERAVLEGTKAKLLIDNIVDREFLRDSVQAMVSELQALKKEHTSKSR